MHRLRNGFMLGSMLATALILNAQEVVPGTINFSEGQVTLDGTAIPPDAVGSARLTQGITLQTEEGRVEVILTPGIYVRMGEKSALKMNAESGGEIKLALLHGQAVVEVDQLDKIRHISLSAQGIEARLDHLGLFRVEADHPKIAVYEGKVRAEDDRRGIEVKKGEQLLLGGTSVKTEKFAAVESDPLYVWSQQRADFASRVSEWTGEILLALDGRPHYTDGWYWNNWYKSWAFIPVKGYVRTPFNYGIYAPNEPHSVMPVFGDFRD